MSFNISLNETNDNTQSNERGSYYLAAITSTNVIVSMICLLYSIFKLSINKFIKIILCIMAIQNIFSSTVMTLANILAMALNSQSYMICQSICSSMFVQFRSNSIMTALISILRYVMFSKIIIID